jgi:XTP/dITP diphosphohydrolase
VDGEIADAPRGDGGFGYDPIFYYPEYRATLAEVTEPEKLRVAHRGHAFRALARWLERIDLDG